MTTPPALAKELLDGLERAAAARRLLVVSDFDGTLAGFSPDPFDVPVADASLVALEDLASMDDTYAAILSGRDLEGLARVCRDAAGVIRVGSHGAESGHPLELSEAQRTELERITTALHEILDPEPDSFVEHKPYQRCAHVMKLAMSDPARARELLERCEAIDYDPALTHLTHGKNILEFSVVEVTKGTWLAAERERVGADVVVFIGDDRTDENGFAVLGPNDISIKVGEGSTAARYRVEDIASVTAVLQELAARRSSSRDESACATI